MIFIPWVESGWQTLFSASNDTDFGNANPYGLRQSVPASSYALSNDGTLIRFTITAHSTQDGTILSAFIGHAGASLPNFDGNQVQVLFGGSAGATLHHGVDLTTDAASFAFDHTKKLIVSLGVASAWRGGQVTGSGPSGADSYYKSGDQANAGSTTVSGYTTAADSVRALGSVEIA